MTQTFLPGDTRQRIQDLVKNRKITQAELAGKVGLSPSTLSRYLQGETRNLSEGYIIRIAEYFKISTDFLLGKTDIPDRKNYDIEELGLSAEAAKLLYTGKLDSQTLNLLLTHPLFPQLLDRIKRYQDETMAKGAVGFNQLMTFISSRLIEHGKNYEEDKAAAAEAASEVSDMKALTVQYDQTEIQNGFMQIIRDIKKQNGSHLEEFRSADKKILEELKENLVKGQDSMNLRTLTPEDVADSIIQTMAGADLPEDLLSELKSVLIKTITALGSSHDK